CARVRYAYGYGLDSW
nr:immunoglobulin heavy chain junction region [Macaca mulatta]MOV46499.1 immunoglobulin heavy chain junction region [Macaca mulatta]